MGCNYMRLTRYLLSIVAMLCFLPSSHACPKIGRLPDFNCDGVATIVVIGDSLVFGIGDSKNNNSGGYILRAQTSLSEGRIVNQGVPGLRTTAMIRALVRAFAKVESSQTAKDLIGADLVVFDIGRNDFWLKEPASKTLRNIKRARLIIDGEVKKASGFAPLTTTAVLMFPNRGSQGPWIKELNALIVASSAADHPADLRLDTVSKRLLSSDNIHPTPKGYTAMAKVFVDYLLTEYPKHVSTLRLDQDDDGLYDIFEQIRYGTDPKMADTDGDGIKDGADSTPVG